MAIDDRVPLPAWTQEGTPEEQTQCRLHFLLRLASLYHNPKGNLTDLSVACGYGPSALSSIVTGRQKTISAEMAIDIERKVDAELFPRGVFRPDLFR